VIIRLIEVENFLSHKYRRLELPKSGVFQLEGESGSGKSSLICDAPGYALYGFRATRAKTIGTLKRKAHQGKDFWVKVAWELQDGTIFEIIRGVRANGQSFAEIQDNRGGIERGDQAVNRHLRSLIGNMDWRTYHRSFVSRQDELASLTDLEPRDRADFINKMLGIDIFDQAGLEMRRAAKRIQADIRTLEAEVGSNDIQALEALLSASEGKLSAAQEQRLMYEGEINHTKAKLEELLAQLGPAEQAIQSWQEKERELNKSKLSLAELEVRIAQIANLRDQLAEQQKRADGEAGLIKQGIELSAKLKELEELERGYNKRVELNKRLEKIPKDEPQSPGAEPVINRSDLERIQAERQALSQQISQLEKQSQELDSEAGECPVCLRGVDEHVAGQIEAEYTKRIDVLRQTLAQVEQDLARSQALLKEQELALQGWRQKQSAYDLAYNLWKERGTLEDEMSVLPQSNPGEDLNSIRDQLAQLRSQVRDAKTARQWIADSGSEIAKLAELENQKLTLSQSIDALSSALGERPLAPEGLRLQERSLRSRREDLMLKITGNEREQGEHQRECDRLRADIKANSKSQEKLTELRSQAREWTELDALTKGFKVQLASTIRPQIQDTASQIMANLSESRFTGLEITEEYDIYLTSQDGNIWESHMLSGGEKVRANFALRLALTRLISERTGTPIQYLILDEIFAAQDPAHQHRIIDILKTIQAYYPQIFLISHVGSIGDSELVNHVIDVSQDDVTMRAN
jgi:exonuclease SbcC